MKALNWIIALPVAVVAISFAISNREDLSLGLFPLPGEYPLPAYVAVLGAFVIGFLCGGAVSWYTGRRWRRLARNRAGDITMLNSELVDARRRLEAARQSSETTSHRSDSRSLASAD